MTLSIPLRLPFSPQQMPSSLSSPELWSRLKSFQFDQPEASFPFSKRLAREQNWTHEFALRAIEEYKRFIYLAVVAKHSVTPSEEVDAAWHLHLCYTHSYWDELCQQVLKRKLHHNPTQGGTEQSLHFRNQYSLTLESYQNEFGESAPESIWPELETRFQAPGSFNQNSSTYSIRISKRWTHLSLACLGTGILAVGCTKEYFEDESSKENIILSVIGGFVLLLFIKGLFTPHKNKTRRRRRRGKNDGSSGGCSAGCSNDSGCSSGCGGGCGGGD